MDFSVYSADKILFYFDKWKQIAKWYEDCKRGIFIPENLPAPVTVNLDAAHCCQMNCIGCKVGNILHSKDYDKRIMERDFLLKLVPVWVEWGVEAVCIAGAGESTLNRHFGDFLTACHDHDFPSALIWNGLILLPEMRYLTWIGASVDAATPGTWAEVHGMKDENQFFQVLDNLRTLTDWGVHTTYKFLIRPENIYEIYDAAADAERIGCKYFQVRPMANPWFSDPRKSVFTDEQVEIGMEQLERAKSTLKKIEVNGTFTKFGAGWKVEHPYEKCFAIFMYAIFLANRRVLLCADRYGCDPTEVGPFDNPEDFVKNFWGSKEHFEMQSLIDVQKWSRCNHKIFNQLMEVGVLQDGMQRKFL
jgi:wyosine [tRNA(Phe)-imidazoG37] synthetase (radical SAM superfamily)